MVRKRPLILIVAGPTGSGKSSLGIALCKAVNGEVVNADSVQLYKGCVIGAATVTADEMGGVPHHLFGVIPPSAPFDVAKYCGLARETMNEVLSRGKTPVFVGGTSLYITALLYGLADLPGGVPALRRALEMLTNDQLIERLSSVDPVTAGKLHPHDRVRIIRALEVLESGGRQFSAAVTEHGNKEALLDARIIVPTWERAALYDRIERRTQKMIEAGLIEEVRQLADQYGPRAPALRSIGYAETVLHLAGRLSLEQLKEEIAKNTRRFAKRQMTWLRNQPVKQQWKVRPHASDPVCTLEGDLSRFPKPGKVKQFSVWDIDRKTLEAELKTALITDAAGIEVVFVPGTKVV